MASVHIHVYTDGRELLEGVGNAGLVRCLSVRALLHVQVGDEVGEGVGLDDRNDAHIGELLDLRNDLVDIIVVLLLAAIGNAELPVGCLCRTVTVGQIVDDDLDQLLLAAARLEGRGVREVGAEVGNLGDGVEPGECGDIGDAGSLSSQTRVGDVGGGSLNLRSVVGA